MTHQNLTSENRGLSRYLANLRVYFFFGGGRIFLTLLLKANAIISLICIRIKETNQRQNI